MVTVAQKVGKNAYNQRSRKQLNINFYPCDHYMWEYLNSFESAPRTAKDAISLYMLVNGAEVPEKDAERVAHLLGKVEVEQVGVASDNPYGFDKPILDWLSAQPDANIAVRNAIRNEMARKGVR